MKQINLCLQTVKALTTLMAPFLPFTAARCLKMLRLDEGALQWSQATRELPAGHPLGEATVLFPRLE